MVEEADDGDVLDVPPVYRAPMRSRDERPGRAVERALAIGVVGMDEGGDQDERWSRRLDRFSAAPIGAWVWTRDSAGGLHLGQVTGRLRRDDGGADAGLVHVRDCRWAPTIIDPAMVPSAVWQTFARGGANFQQTHVGEVETETATLWTLLNS